MSLSPARTGLQAAVRTTLGAPESAGSGVVQQQVLTAADGAPGDFGLSVTISGSTAVVGAYNAGRGVAFVFVLRGTIAKP